jgi:hypothetical protein
MHYEKILGIVLAAATLGCGFQFPVVKRIAPPVELPSGEPESACEEKGWLDLVPAAAETKSNGPSPLAHHHRVYTSRQAGLALYPRVDSSLHALEGPIPLDEDVPQIRDKDLLARHIAPSVETLGQDRKSKGLLIASGLVTLAGTGAGLGILDDLDSVAREVSHHNLEVRGRCAPKDNP